MEERSAPLPPPPPRAAPAATKNGTNQKAILALVLGVAGVYPATLVGSIGALFLGYKSLREIKRSGQKGHALAITGIILAWVVIAAAMVLLVWASVVCAREHCG